MELNIPIKAVKQKPMANMDFIRTCKQKGQRQSKQQAYTEGLWAHTLKNRLCTASLESRRKKDDPEGQRDCKSDWRTSKEKSGEQMGTKAATEWTTDVKSCFKEKKKCSQTILLPSTGWVFSLSLYNQSAGDHYEDRTYKRKSDKLITLKTSWRLIKMKIAKAGHEMGQ